MIRNDQLFETPRPQRNQPHILIYLPSWWLLTGSSTTNYHNHLPPPHQAPSHKQHTFYNHKTTLNHETIVNNTKNLCSENDTYLQSIPEVLLIRKLQPSINKKVEATNINLFNNCKYSYWTPTIILYLQLFSATASPSLTPIVPLLTQIVLDRAPYFPSLLPFLLHPKSRFTRYVPYNMLKLYILQYYFLPTMNFRYFFLATDL